MPNATATENQRPRDYTGFLWKGLNPFAVQVWPWNPETDTLQLGTTSIPTGVEDSNGAVLLRNANFQPLSVNFAEQISAAIVLREETSKK